jgi:hypothetical protein
MRLREITNKDLDDYAAARLSGYEFTNEKGEHEKRPGVGAWSINKEILLGAFRSIVLGCHQCKDTQSETV